LKFYLSILLLAIALSSCFNKRIPPKQLYCVPIVESCVPTIWNGVERPTGPNSADSKGLYYVLDKVEDKQFYSNYYGFFASSSFSALISVEYAGRQQIAQVQIAFPNKLKEIELIRTPVNRHYGTPSKSKNNTIYFAKSIIGSDSAFGDWRRRELSNINNSFGNSRIYTADLRGNEFRDEKIVNTGAIADTTWESHPAISPKSDYLFFASDRQDGNGGTDIWYMSNDGNGNWGTPINCGENINTPCDELSPFISKDNYLYFSSCGHNNIGGFDIFRSKINKSGEKLVFSEPENIGAPINSKYDELFPFVHHSFDTLFYFTSNRDLKHELYVWRKRKAIEEMESDPLPEPDFAIESEDLLEIDLNPNIETKITDQKNVVLLKKNIPEPPKEYIKTEVEKPQEVVETKLVNQEIVLAKKESEKFLIEGTVLDQKTNMPIEKAKIIAESKSPNKRRETTSDKDGGYSLELEKGEEYELTSQKSNYFFDSFKVYLEPGGTTTTIRKDFALPEILVLRINFPYNIYDQPYPKTLDSLGLETDKSWQSELDKLADNIRQSGDKLRYVMIEGHTDDQGGIQFNRTLGENRALFVLNQLVDRGIDKKLLKFQSKGKEAPLKQSAGEDIELYRKKLRRVVIEKVFK